MAWRCRFLAARRSQHGRVITEKWLSEELSVHPTQVDFHTGKKSEDGGEKRKKKKSKKKDRDTA